MIHPCCMHDGAECNGGSRGGALFLFLPKLASPRWHHFLAFSPTPPSLDLLPPKRYGVVIPTMMEKLPFHSHEGLRGDVSPAVPTASTTSQRDRAFRHILAAIISLSLAFFLIVSRPSVSIHGSRFFSCHKSAKVLDDGSTVSAAIDHPHGASANRVPFEAHVMSKCPDARGCLQQLVIPAMEQISDKVDFELSFIAK